MNDLGRKATDLLAHFLEDLKDGASRTILLDREIIIKLLEFLSKCDESKRITLYTSLTWFNYFLDFFRQDFLAVLQQHNPTQGIEESKDEDKQQSKITLDPQLYKLL